MRTVSMCKMTPIGVRLDLKNFILISCAVLELLKKGGGGGVIRYETGDNEIGLKNEKICYEIGDNAIGLKNETIITTYNWKKSTIYILFVSYTYDILLLSV